MQLQLESLQSQSNIYTPHFFLVIIIKLTITKVAFGLSKHLYDFDILVLFWRYTYFTVVNDRCSQVKLLYIYIRRSDWFSVHFMNVQVFYSLFLMRKVGYVLSRHSEWEHWNFKFKFNESWHRQNVIDIPRLITARYLNG